MRKIVWTNGCFDILHRGHIELFKYAKSLGDTLLVGVDSDFKVKQDKGEDRPFNNEEDRIELLNSIRYIDKVFLFNAPEQLDRIIKNVQAQVMVVGSDWKGKKVVGESHVEELVFFDRISKYSTSKILQCSLR
tara:strand:+ start:2265 stop:2663 length:399 start_codon:yes stop_codon:yes gene_type:complete